MATRTGRVSGLAAVTCLLILATCASTHDGIKHQHSEEEMLIRVSPSEFYHKEDETSSITESTARQPVLQSVTSSDNRNNNDKLRYSDFYSSETEFNNYASVYQFGENVIEDDNEESDHNTYHDKASKVKREAFAVPTVEDILVSNDLETSSSNLNEHLASTNDVTDINKGNFYDRIQPTKTTTKDSNFDILSTSSVDHPNFDEFPGEGVRASARGRALPLPKPNSATTMAAQNFNGTFLNATVRSDNRKTNPDIQDIISGFVKLLNGNVQVQVNPNPQHPLNGRPHHPVRTRINNRGPPRITDVPPIDFDSPLPPMRPPYISKHPPPPSTRIPPPYPFDIPPSIASLPPQPTSVIKPFVSGVPLPEQIVPTGPTLPTGPDNYHQPEVSLPTRPPQKQKPNSPLKKPVIIELKPDLTLINQSDYLKPTEPVSGIFKPVNSFIEPSKITPMTQPSFTLVKPQEELPAMNSTPNPSVSFENKTSTTEIIITTSPTRTETPSTTILSVDVSSSVTSMNNLIKNNSNTNITEGSSVKNTVAQSKVEVPSIAATPTTATPMEISLKTTPSSSSSSSSPPLPVTPTTVKTKVKTVVASSTPTSIISAVPASGIGSAVAVLESSIQEISSQEVHKPTRWETPGAPSKPSLQTETHFPYYPRPGIVLDDPEYKPGGGSHHRPIVTSPPQRTGTGSDIFDVTVSAVQGPGSSNTGQPFVYSVEIEGVQVGGAGAGEVSVITTAEAGQHFVSIDGKRTYINLFGSSQPSLPLAPTNTQKQPPIKSTPGTYSIGQVGGSVRPPTPTNKRPPIHRRPAHPPVRIDTCIVGDDSTCDAAQNERCRTEVGVSSCHCKPGYSRRKHREPCHRIVSIVMSLRVDRLYEQRVTWSDKLRDKDSQEYLQMEYEASRALDSAMSMTPFSDAFLGCRVNNMYTAPQASGSGDTGTVFVNMTLQLEESIETLQPTIKHDIQRQLLGVIHRRGNNVGTSALWVDSPPGSISQLQDLDECSSSELHDCHVLARCSNTFGSFQCSCPEGYRDPWAGNQHRSGRECHTCPPDHCNHRGECRYQNDQPVCKCAGSYYGAQCEIDGEVLGVAIGASVAAVIIIVSTLICLCMWSRRWSREQKVAAGMGSPVFGYMATGGSTVKTPGVGAPPYQVSLEDRLRWAQIADVMAHATNHYAPEPVGGPTRPSSAMFGYAGTLPHLAAPVPLPRLGLRPASVHGMRPPDSSSSEEEDRADLLGRNFQVPRPKSRSSVANQSGIYYDVDYEQQADVFATTKQHPSCIPMSTYTMGRSHYYRT